MLSLQLVPSAFARPWPPSSIGQPRPAGMNLSPSMSATATGRVPGSASSRDGADFRADPSGFCRTRLAKYGATFETGVDGSVIFVGDSAGLELAASAAPLPGAPLQAPFPDAPAGGDELAALVDAFNEECYATIFEWIPKYKEAGFSTFRFEDFIDGRVRKLVPSTRRLFLRAAAQPLLGASWDELPARMGLESGKQLASLYNVHARSLVSDGGLGGLPFKLPFDAPKLPFGGSGGGGGGTAELEAALGRLVGGGAGGADTLCRLASSVEQCSALLDAMIIAEGRHPALAKSLADERAAALDGLAPTAAVGVDVLEEMPLLHAFALEALRLEPVSRPSRVAVASAAELEGGFTIPEGAVLAPEPFLAHFDGAVYAGATAFDPSRYDRGEPPPRAGLAGPVGTSSEPGGALALTLAKVAFAQLSRMFEMQVGAEPAPQASGFPVRRVQEKVEILLKPRMYYELQRGVKKLSF